jgi:hypothetical protein
MATGRPPGCWVSPELLAVVQTESRARDGGRQARLERAARTVAILRGLGYAGAYIGGTHDAAHIAWIIRRADELAPQWEALAAELGYGAAGGFYLPARAPAKRPAVKPRVLDWLGRALPVSRDTWLRRALTHVFAWIDRRKHAAALVERVELAIKKPFSGPGVAAACWAISVRMPGRAPSNFTTGPAAERIKFVSRSSRTSRASGSPSMTARRLGRPRR